MRIVARPLSLWRWALCLAVLAGICLAVGGERPLAAVSPALAFGPGHTVGDAAGPIKAMVAGDLDWDAWPDLVTAAGTQIQAWENSGAPFGAAWATHSLASAPADVYALALGDLDLDGDPDLVAGLDVATTHELLLLKNDGAPFDAGWGGSGAASPAATIYALAVGDLDQDGRLDIVTGDGDGLLRTWWNDGTPFSGLWSPNLAGDPDHLAVYALAAGDLDLDGDLDLASLSSSFLAVGPPPWPTVNHLILWRNGGSPFSGAWTSVSLLSTRDRLSGLILADQDGDGDLDIVLGQLGETQIWQNPGPAFTGAWHQQTAGALSKTVLAVAAGDWDVDGDLDLASGTLASSAEAEVWAWESQAGVWSGVSVGETAGRDVQALAGLDLDLDGDPDLAAAAAGRVLAWPNNHVAKELGGWTAVAQPAPALDTLAVDLGDLDHDGKLDLAAGTKAGVLAWRGDGGHSWTRVGASYLPADGDWLGVAWGQINQRHELDLAAAGYDVGAGAWAAQEGATVWDDISSGLPKDGRFLALALGHVDHDGYLDLVATGDGLGVSAWQGAGSSWNYKATLGGTASFSDVALGPLDHDGHLDLAAARSDGGGLLLCRGGGGFGFDCSGSPASSGSYAAVALGDLNRDGWTDLVAAPATGGVQVWLASGGGAWLDGGVLEPGLSVESLDLGDMDHDGYADILAGGDGVHVWRGDGGTSWEGASANLPTTGSYPGVAFGLVDGDAFLDIAAAESGGSGVRIWTAAEPPPGGWAEFAPETNPPFSWMRVQRLDCSVGVIDSGAGLDVATARYRFSRDGGATWVVDASSDSEGWRTASCSGSTGSTDPERITASAVPFDQDSADQNAIQFRIADMDGFVGASPLYRVAIDATPPINPATASSTSHEQAVWNPSRTVVVTWSDGIDATSGPWAYSYALTSASSFLPDMTPDPAAGNSGQGTADADGQWWFHLRTQDRAGNWAGSAKNVGPFWIDSRAPNSEAVAAATPGDPSGIDVSCQADDGLTPHSGVVDCDLQVKQQGAASWEPLQNNVAPDTPVHYSGTGGRTYCFRSRARDGAGNVEAWPPGLNGDACVVTSLRDLQIISIEPVQTIEGASLIQGKGTVFRVRVSSSFPDEVDVEFQLNLPAADWRTHPVCGNHVIGLPPSWSYPDTWGPIRLQPGPNDILLPHVPAGQEDASWSETPAGIYPCGCYSGLCAPDTRVVPRPRDASVTAEVVVDPGNHIAETDEANNRAAMPATAAVETKDFTIYLTPYVFNLEPQAHLPTSAYEFHLTQQGYPDAATRLADVIAHTSQGRTGLSRALSSADIDRLRRDAKNYVEYILAAYPLADDQVTYYLDDRYLYFRDEYRLAKVGNRCSGSFPGMLYDQIMREASPAPDLVIAFHIWGCCGQSPMADPVHDYKPGRYIDIGAGLELAGATWNYACEPGTPLGPNEYGRATEYVAAHELAHNLCGAPDCYGCWKPADPADCDYCKQDADGFWVNRWDARPQVEAPDAGLYFMHAVCDNCRFWTRLNPVRSKAGVDFVDGYQNAITYLTPGFDPTALLVRGSLAKSGQASFDPFLLLDGAAIDLAPGQEGDYAFVLLGQGGSELARIGFSPSFLVSGWYPDPISEVEEIRFLYRIAWQAGTRRIELRNEEGEVLASRDVSANSPSVTLLSPNGGESFWRGDAIPIQWSASDLDGDALSHALAISADDGQTWLPVDVDLSGEEYPFNAGDVVPGRAYRIRVRSSDGVNTAEDISDGAFTIRGPVFLPLVYK